MSSTFTMNDFSKNGKTNDKISSETSGKMSSGARSEMTFSLLMQMIDKTHVSVLKCLNSTRPEAKQEFLDNPELRQPNNTRENLRLGGITQRADEIKRLYDVIESSDLTSKQRMIAKMALDENYKANQFLLACASYNEDPGLGNLLFYSNACDKYYGRPDEATFLSLLNEELKAAKINAQQKGTPEIFEKITEMLGDVKAPSIQRYAPKPETVARMHEIVMDFYAPIFALIPENKDEFTIQEAADVANVIFAEILPENSKWHAKVDPNTTAASVSQEDFCIYFPGRRALGNYTRKALLRIIIHEFGVHAFRGAIYEPCEISMIRTGLPQYEIAEEGIAKLMEQALEGKFNDSGVARLRYITSGIAVYKNFDFRKTFELMRRIEQLNYNRTPAQTYDTVQRAFRGTDVLPNTKDIVYLDGLIALWKFVEENIDNPNLFELLLLCGKTNPMNREHRSLVYELKTGGIRLD